ncbi:lambda family phage tail tape measure protein [Aliiruegeria haliotis]|uniref:Lambda family phage tail tape measure protein n=1 Tax=Aliiruegeria haliotis TaxID=1280846 RepID=A0A2T0RYG1_9RHOB|nr:phage tail tape measure protein [Aliiruegeria haliotis]PRY26219.1 lambda family phage tail tape measure protein [Aliiruegeria haliotis]
MALESGQVENIEQQLGSLEASLGGVGTMVAAFDTELRKLQSTTSQANASTGALSTSISGGLRKAFDGLVLDGGRASDAMKTVAQSIVNATYSSAIKPVTSELGGLISSGIAGFGQTLAAQGSSILQGALPFAGGGSFSSGRVMPFAKGGVVAGPTAFPMRGATGLMGEAGPEAIMPLTRGADGSLGVRAANGGGRPVQVVMNINTPDVAGFQKSQSQIAAQLGRVIGRGQRNS